jgi:outer membrane protein assembly factor BamB
VRALVLVALVVAAGVWVMGGRARGSGAAASPVRANTLWLSYGHDAQLTNDVASTTLNAGTVGKIRLAWAAQLDGAIVASPLYAPAVAGGRRLELVFVETEAGSLYALNAADGSVVWQRSFGTVQTPSCGTYGFSSTGVIDLGRGLIYAISADGWLHALSLATGVEAPGWPIAVTAARNQVEYVWGGLRILDGRLYLGVASYCDAPDANNVAAEGRLLSINLDDLTDIATFDPVPGYGNLGGIWSWGGISVEPGGSFIYTGVGNSYVFDAGCGCYTDTAGYGDSMLKLTAGLQVVAANRPTEVDPTGDDDFGASPVLFQPPGCRPYAAANNKVGQLYVWNRDRIGQGPIIKFGLGDGLAAFVGAPAYSASQRSLYEAHAFIPDKNGKPVGEGVAKISIDQHCHFTLNWRTQTGNDNEPPPLIVNDLVFSPDGTNGNYTILDATTCKKLWTYPPTARKRSHPRSTPTTPSTPATPTAPSEPSITNRRSEEPSSEATPSREDHA